MEVACSTFCFAGLSLDQSLRRIAEMEFGRVDLGIADDSTHVTPDEAISNPAAVLHRIRQGPTIGFAAITLRVDPLSDGLRERVAGIARFAKQLSAPYLVVDAAPAGQSIEAEASRLSSLARVVSMEGVILCVTTRMGAVTEQPGNTLKLCEMVPGLKIALDPSHLIAGPNQGKSFESLYPFVCHVILRDSGKKAEELQVKVGRGVIEYGKIIASLKKQSYTGALVIDIEEGMGEPLEIPAEVRKLQLLLESLI